MANKHEIRFDLKGHNTRPDSIGMGDLGDLLKHLDAAIRTGVPPEQRVAHAKDPDPLVSLISIKEGNSSDMAMVVLDYGLPALGEITGAISSGDYTTINSRTHEELYNISKWTARRRVALEFEGDDRLGISPATISRKHPVPPPSAPKFKVDGVTTAWGYLLQAGGKKPRVALLFPDGEKVILTADEVIAKELGQRLYEDVGIEGVATWSVPGWRMVSFRATRVLDYQPQRTDLVQTFKDLAQASEGRWNDVDAESYVRELRGETEE
jgi:hypothetical protein